MSARFWQKVQPRPSGCWEWTATTDHRYGLFCVDGRMEKAHRVAWMLTVGPIPQGKHVLHHCDNTLCVRPAHLFLGSPADNAHDRDAKGRQVAPKGEAHAHAKLTEVAIRDIRSSGASPLTLAARYGVTVTNIYYVLRRATWRHVE